MTRTLGVENMALIWIGAGLVCVTVVTLLADEDVKEVDVRVGLDGVRFRAKRSGRRAKARAGSR